MTIRRCVPNLVSGDLGASRGFYAGLLGFEVAMDEDDLTMYRSPSNPTAQVTVGTDAESAWDPEVHRPRLSGRWRTSTPSTPRPSAAACGSCTR